MTIPLQPGLVYGPVKSRRLGMSLGVNLLPECRKVCTFNCAYCQYGWTPPDPLGTSVLDENWASPDAVADAVDEALARAGGIDRITLAGNGEPTLHPDFRDVVERLRLVRNRRARYARLAVLSNASTLSDRSVVAALLRLDERYMKLDAGDDATLRKMNGSGVGIDAIVAGLKRVPDITLQALFTRDAEGKIDNTTDEAVDHWLKAVAAIRPSAVHIYTIDREPAWEALQRVPESMLQKIAGKVSAAGIRAVVF
jgi:wyosine [tRNA(Phe)-imidazoG37] synthetase (radical SAM superfamily)